MAIKHTYFEEENIVRVEATGVLTISEIENYLKAVMENDNIKDGFVEIFNLKGVQDFNFSFQNGKRIVSLYSMLMKNKQYRGAIHISPGHIQFGISHLMAAILENTSIVFTISDSSEIEVALNQF